MSFDNTNPLDQESLYLELTDDPLSITHPPGMQYDQASGNTNKLLSLLNDPLNNAETPIPVTSEDFNTEIMVSVLGAPDLADNKTNVKAAEYTLILMQAEFVGVDLSRDKGTGYVNYRQQWRNMFDDNSGTAQRLDALSRDMSRGEVLYGLHTVLVRDDILAARDWGRANDPGFESKILANGKMR